MNQTFERYLSLVEEALRQALPQPEGSSPTAPVEEAMAYSLFVGGKRIRPVLALGFCQLCGGAPEQALPFACAVEMVHTYSLIHDDLPCMDNDDLRRGKPTCHKVYGECTAVLAGDALQAEAFSRLATSRRTQRVESNGEACAVLAQAAGAIQGICTGQYLDMNGDNQTEERLNLVHSWKTAALLKAACLLGLTASPVAPTMAQWKAAKEYAQGLGMAFQIRDDMLDEESTTQQLGKPVGSDRENGKVTYVTLYGLDSCQELVQRYTHRAKLAVQEAFPDTGEFLCALADALAKRDH